MQGMEIYYDGHQKRQCDPIEEHLGTLSAPRFNGQQPESKTSNPISRKSRDQRRRETRLLKIQVCQLNQEIEKLQDQRTADRKELEEQKRIANSLSDQINDGKTLVTKDSLVQELQAEVERERRSHGHAVVLHHRLVQDLRQEIDQLNREHEQEISELKQEHERHMRAYRLQVHAAFLDMAKTLKEGIRNRQLGGDTILSALERVYHAILRWRALDY